MRRSISANVGIRLLIQTMSLFAVITSFVYAADRDQVNSVTGIVQNQDLRRVPQATIELKSQEGTIVATAVTNGAGEFSIAVPAEGTYSVSAVQETYRSEYVVLTVGRDAANPVTLTLSQTSEIALDVVSPLPPIQYKAS